MCSGTHCTHFEMDLSYNFIDHLTSISPTLLVNHNDIMGLLELGLAQKQGPVVPRGLDYFLMPTSHLSW